MLSYIDQVDLFNKRLCEKSGTDPTETPGRIALFRRVLYYDSFYAPSMPVIICEGKTDNTYLKHAIRSLAAAYPTLATADAPPKLKLRLFRYSERRSAQTTERRTAQITELTGGSG